jgi:hypothetical protein
MSRIPAREAVVVSGAVSAVVSLCIVGSIAVAASAAPENSLPRADGNGVRTGVTNAPYSPLVTDSPDTAGNDGPVGGSRQGVWFGLRQPSDWATPSAAAATADSLGPAAPAATTAKEPPPAHATVTASPAVREQSRSSVQAAISGGDPRDMARALAATYSWTGTQWTCLDKLWDHESKYETTVRNPTSGAYGIPQALPASKMSSAGADWRTNPVTQIVWGLGYIEHRYGSPCDAWSYWLRHMSY